MSHARERFDNLPYPPIYTARSGIPGLPQLPGHARARARARTHTLLCPLSIVPTHIHYALSISFIDLSFPVYREVLEDID